MFIELFLLTIMLSLLSYNKIIFDSNLDKIALRYKKEFLLLLK